MSTSYTHASLDSLEAPYRDGLAPLERIRDVIYLLEAARNNGALSSLATTLVLVKDANGLIVGFTVDV